MSWISRCLNALNQEPEEWLNYLHGSRKDEVWKIIARENENAPSQEEETNTRHLNPCPVEPLRVPSPKLRRKSQKSVLAFWGTRNQETALSPSLNELQRRDIKIHAFRGTNADQATVNYETVHTTHQNGMLVILKSLPLLALRLPQLFAQKRNVPHIPLAALAVTFTAPHRALVFFDRAVRKIRPDLVIVSNDHELQNRCLISVARMYGIPTVYLQHASVSPLFPALSFDYAFLDGEISLELYLQCEKNKPHTLALPQRTNVILSGVKRPLSSKPSTSLQSSRIGVALNSNISTETAVRLLSFLSSRGFSCRIRLHPGTTGREKELLEQTIVSLGFEMSDPAYESQKGFFTQICALIAPDSGIHLESSLSGVPSLLFGGDTASSPDYYGFVRNGLVQDAKSLNELAQWLRSVQENKVSVNSQVAQRYSATVGSHWSGREGELVAITLEALLEGIDPSIQTRWTHTFKLARDKRLAREH